MQVKVEAPDVFIDPISLITEILELKSKMSKNVGKISA